jgi:hypothetical protein
MEIIMVDFNLYLSESPLTEKKILANEKMAKCHLEEAIKNIEKYCSYLKNINRPPNLKVLECSIILQENLSKF